MLFLIFSVFFLCVLTRGFQVQILSGSRIKNLAERQYWRRMTLAGKRGEILDRFGESLAITAPVKSLFLDPAKVEHPWGIAKRVAPRIGRNWKPLYDKIRVYQRKGRRFLWVRIASLVASLKRGDGDVKNGLVAQQFQHPVSLSFNTYKKFNFPRRGK
jgi:cell division protein FtsI (penicillin-binding protein 3)